MAFSLIPTVPGDSASGHGTSLSITHTATAGNLLVVLVASSANSAQPTFTVSDSGGNTYSQTALEYNSGLLTQIFYTVVTTGGSLTITIGSSATAYYGATAVEASGQASSPFDQSATGFAYTNTPTTSSVTPGGNGALCLGVMTHAYFSGATMTPGTGWTNLFEQDSQATEAYVVAAQIQTTAAATAANWTLGSSDVDNSATSMAVFKAAGASASFTVAPSTIPASHSGAITLTLSGTGTTWTSGSTVTLTNSLTGTTTVTKGTWTQSSATAATLTVTTGSGTGTYKITVDGVDSPSLTVGTASFTLAPTSVGAGDTTTVAATGTNTVWTQETASSLFGVSGVTGLTLGSITVLSNTTATFQAIAGPSTGTATVTDTPTGDTQTLAVVTPRPRVVCLGDSQTYGYGLAGVPDTVPVTPGSNTYPGQLSTILGSTWSVYNAGTSGYTFAQMQSHLAANVTPYYNASASHNIILVMGGANNIDSLNGNQTGAQAYADLRSLVSACVSGGWTVAVMPLIACDVGTNFQTGRTALNTLIDANWRSFASGFGGLDVDSRIGLAGDQTNTTYYQSDQLHPTAAGAAILAQYAAAAVGLVLAPGGAARDHIVRFRIGSP